MIKVDIQTHNVSHFKDKLDYLLQHLDNYKFRRATGFGRRSGESIKRDNLSEYEYINTRSVYRKPELKKEIEKVTDHLNLTQNTLVYYALRFQPNDFLDWMDYFLWQETRAFVGKFFSIAMEGEGTVHFKHTEPVTVPQYHAIEFSPKHIHAVKPVNSRQTWLVLMVSNHLVLKDKIYNK